MLAKPLLTFIGLFISQVIFANVYLWQPTGKYDVGFQDVRLVNGTYTSAGYSCPGETDLLYSPEYEQDYGLDNQKDFCREIAVWEELTHRLMAVLSYLPIIIMHCFRQVKAILLTLTT